MNVGRLLPLPGGGTLGSIDRARLRPPGSRPRGRREGSALQAGWLLFRHELPRGKVQTLSRREEAQASGEWRKPPTVAAKAVIPELDRDGPHLDRDRSKLWREKSPGEHRPGVVIPAGTTRSRERTPGGSKASKRACRSFTASSAGRGNDRRLGAVTLRVVGLAPRPERVRTAVAGIQVAPPGVALTSFGTGDGKGTSPLGESDRETPRHAAPRTDRTRTRTEAQACESGHGSPGRESSEGQHHERERHETRPRNVGAPR